MEMLLNISPTVLVYKTDDGVLAYFPYSNHKGFEVVCSLKKLGLEKTWKEHFNKEADNVFLEYETMEDDTPPIITIIVKLPKTHEGECEKSTWKLLSFLSTPKALTSLEVPEIDITSGFEEEFVEQSKVKCPSGCTTDLPLELKKKSEDIEGLKKFFKSFLVYYSPMVSFKNLKF